MTINKESLIVCPHCGTEYLPEEIFTYSSFLGKPKNIVKDALGKIIYLEYEEDRKPDFTEHFICDSCNKSFVTEIKLISSTREELEELDFTNPYTSFLDD